MNAEQPSKNRWKAILRSNGANSTAARANRLPWRQLKLTLTDSQGEQRRLYSASRRAREIPPFTSAATMPIWPRMQSLVHRRFPGLAMHVRSARIRRKTIAADRANGTERVRSKVVERLGLKVQGGHFAGLEYVGEAVCSNLVPKLVGTYELELSDVIGEILSRNVSRVIDIGSAEGYYAVGLAMRLPMAQVDAFDTDPHARKLCSRLAALNGVQSRVKVRGACTPATLQQVAGDQTLVFCDCEGYEQILLDTRAVPALGSSLILVECHDHLVPGTTDLLRGRFSATHDIQIINTTPRSGDETMLLPFLNSSDRLIAVNEFRDVPQNWLWMQPLRSSDHESRRDARVPG